MICFYFSKVTAFIWRTLIQFLICCFYIPGKSRLRRQELDIELWSLSESTQKQCFVFVFWHVKCMEESWGAELWLEIYIVFNGVSSVWLVNKFLFQPSPTAVVCCSSVTVKHLLLAESWVTYNKKEGARPAPRSSQVNERGMCVRGHTWHHTNRDVWHKAGTNSCGGRV